MQSHGAGVVVTNETVSGAIRLRKRQWYPADLDEGRSEDVKFC